MKHIVILGDGMADHPIVSLGGKTVLQYVQPATINRMAREGRCGRLQTIPVGYLPGSEVANTAILGYNLDAVYEGRGPLEAASIGYEMRADDLALRCNIITLSDTLIESHHGGHLKTEEAGVLIDFLNKQLGNDRIQFVRGIQYRHLLIVRGGNKHIVCAPPHDHPDEAWRPLMVRCEEGWENRVEPGRMTAQETADLLNDLILRSQQLLAQHPFNLQRKVQGKPMANSIWPWSGGYRPQMEPLTQLYPTIRSGVVISAVDLIRGIGHYAGLRIVDVPGATGLADTNYEGKAQAALEALRHNDFVFLHLEASDEAGHDGDRDLKIKTVEYLENRIVKPIFEAISAWQDPVCIAVLPDHPTPVEIRTHLAEPVPFLIWYPGIQPDSVQQYDEISCVQGSYGLLRLEQFMQQFMKIQ